MVVELCIILALALGFAAGLVVGRCCGARAQPPSEPERQQPDPLEVLPPTVYMAPTAKTVYHLSKTCQHIGDNSRSVLVCKDCVREKACKDLRKRGKEM